MNTHTSPERRSPSTKHTLENAKKKHRKAKRSNRIFTTFVILVALFAVGSVVFQKLFVIRAFRVESDTGVYTDAMAEDMAQSIGLSKGMHLFAFDKNAAGKTAVYTLSQFDKVNIRYDLPDTVVFEVTEAEPLLYVTLENDTHFALSEGLRVVFMTRDLSEIESLALKRLSIGGITHCVAGEFLETENDYDKTLMSLLSVLKEEKVLGDVREIDVTNKFALSFDYKGKYTVRLGDADNLSVKIRFMKSIESKLAENDSGIIDVSDDNYREGFFKPY